MESTEQTEDLSETQISQLIAHYGEQIVEQVHNNTSEIINKLDSIEQLFTEKVKEFIESETIPPLKHEFVLDDKEYTKLKVKYYNYNWQQMVTQYKWKMSRSNHDNYMLVGNEFMFDKITSYYENILFKTMVELDFNLRPTVQGRSDSQAGSAVAAPLPPHAQDNAGASPRSPILNATLDHTNVVDGRTGLNDYKSFMNFMEYFYILTQYFSDIYFAYKLNLTKNNKGLIDWEFYLTETLNELQFLSNKYMKMITSSFNNPIDYNFDMTLIHSTFKNELDNTILYLSNLKNLSVKIMPIYYPVQCYKLITIDNITHPPIYFNHPDQFHNQHKS